ncbi:hypothetical protein AVEN_193579-1 [Araneus ventricosus]|uniref:Uncharacterized protein n=1 Tax=Araneus ventricosus TaxID=182803 RepID=A0A4Y2TGG4_ARAVE|nr:hypothetical protein AVEN_193579-1 [Araneus ventricosus]
MHDTESRKILKRVCKCWLSLSCCLARLVEHWNPLTSFLKAEIHNNGSSSTSGLRDYKIPILNWSCLSSPRSEVGKEKKFVPKEKTSSGERSSNAIPSSVSEVQKRKNIVSKEKTCYSNKRNTDSFASSVSKVSKL